jgi:hypothetical protein
LQLEQLPEEHREGMVVRTGLRCYHDLCPILSCCWSGSDAGTSLHVQPPWVFQNDRENIDDSVRQLNKINKRRKGKRVISTQLETIADWTLTWNANWDCHMG